MISIIFTKLSGWANRKKIEKHCLRLRQTIRRGILSANEWLPKIHAAPMATATVKPVDGVSRIAAVTGFLSLDLPSAPPLVYRDCLGCRLPDLPDFRDRAAHRILPRINPASDGTRHRPDRPGAAGGDISPAFPDLGPHLLNRVAAILRPGRHRHHLAWRRVSDKATTYGPIPTFRRWSAGRSACCFCYP